MKKACITIFLFILVCISVAYGEGIDDIITSYVNPATGRRMERINIDRLKTDTQSIVNDSVESSCKITSWKEIEYTYENLKTGDVIEITGNTENGFTKKQKNRKNNRVIKKEFDKKGRLTFCFYAKYFKNVDNKDHLVPDNTYYRFDEKGNVSDSIADFKISIDDVLRYIKEQYQTHKNYPLNPDSIEIDWGYHDSFLYWKIIAIRPFKSEISFEVMSRTNLNMNYYQSLEIDSNTGELKWFASTNIGGLEEYDSYFFLQAPLDSIKYVAVKPISSKEKAAIAKETFDMTQYHTDSVVSDSVKSSSVVRNRITINYKKENKKIKTTIGIYGNILEGFEKDVCKEYVCTKSKNYTKCYERDSFDIQGNLRKYQKFDTLYNVHNPIYSCQYDVNGNVIKETDYEKEYYRFTRDDLDQYIRRKLMKDIKKMYHVTSTVKHPKSEFQWITTNSKDGKGILVHRGIKDGKYIWYLYLINLSFTDKQKHTFTVDIDGNTGAVINIHKVEH